MAGKLGLCNQSSKGRRFLAPIETVFLQSTVVSAVDVKATSAKDRSNAESGFKDLKRFCADDSRARDAIGERHVKRTFCFGRC